MNSPLNAGHVIECKILHSPLFWNEKKEEENNGISCKIQNKTKPTKGF